MKKPTLKKIIWICIPVLFTGIAAIVFLLNKNQSRETKGDCYTVSWGTIIDRLWETGTIELVRTVEVKSGISGKIKQLLIEEGDIVKKNQLLAIVEPDPNQALLLYEKRASVEKAKIDYLEKQRQMDRNKTLMAKNLISKQEMETSENIYQLALNTYKQALLEQRILELEMNATSTDKDAKQIPKKITELDDYRILAPISGLVISRSVEVGEMVVTGISAYMVGTTICQIGDPSEMIVKSFISEVDMSKLCTGQDVTIIVDSYPDLTYHGRVKHIAPVGKINPGQTIVTFEVEIEILDSDQRLRQGMSCDVDIVYAQKDSVLYVPVECVYSVMVKDKEDQETTQVDSLLVYRWEGDRYEQVAIVGGLESSNRVEILDGLTPGDEVYRDAAQKYQEIRKHGAGDK